MESLGHQIIQSTNELSTLSCQQHRKAEKEKQIYFFLIFWVRNLNENWLGLFTIFQLHLHFRNSSTEYEWKLYFLTTSSQNACGEAEFRLRERV